MKNSNQLVLDLQESDYSTFSLGPFATWLLSFFCLFCLKAHPVKTSKTNSEYTAFPKFLVSLISWFLGLNHTIPTICKKLEIDNYEVVADSYRSFPNQSNILEWHRDGAFQLVSKLIKIKTGNVCIKFFIFLDPNLLLFRKGKSVNLKDIKNSKKGALSLIPQSARFSKAVDNAIFHEFISFDRDHSLEELVSRVKDILSEMEKRNLQSFFGIDREGYLKFINKADEVLSAGSGDSNSYISFSANPGKMVVFDDKAPHRGGATIDSQRLVLRFVVSGFRRENTLLNKK